MQNAWIASAFSLICAIPVYLMYARINTLYPGNSIFFTAIKILGNFFGNIFIVLFSLYAFYFGAMSMGIFAGFNQVVSMPETSRMLTFVIFSGVCLYILKKGIGTLGNFASIASSVIIFLIILINILSINQWQPYYLFPIFQIKPSTFFGDVFLTGVFPLGEAVILCTLFGFTEKSAKKPLLWGLFIGGFLLVLEILRSIAVLGPGTISLLYYPSYTATGVINIMDFFSRVEVTISVSFYVAQIIKVCICIYGVSSGIGSLLNCPSYKTLVLPITACMISLALILFRNTADCYDFLKAYKYYALFFQVAIPFVLWIFAEFSHLRDKRLASPII